MLSINLSNVAFYNWKYNEIKYTQPHSPLSRPSNLVEDQQAETENGKIKENYLITLFIN